MIDRMQVDDPWQPSTSLTRHVAPPNCLISCNDAIDHNFSSQRFTLHIRQNFLGASIHDGMTSPIAPRGRSPAGHAAPARIRGPRTHASASSGRENGRRGVGESILGPWCNPWCFPGSGCGPVVLRDETMGRRDRSTLGPSSGVHSGRRDGASMARPPRRLFGVEASETLCPMIRMLVKNAEDPADRSRRSSGPDNPAWAGTMTPRVAFLVSTTSDECSTIQAQS